MSSFLIYKNCVKKLMYSDCITEITVYNIPKRIYSELFK